MDQIEHLKKERHQLEGLLLQTQRENERCEEEVKRWKAYSRSLEKKIEHFAGPSWQEHLDVPPTPQPLTLPHYPSTPLTAGRSPNGFLETPLPGNARTVTALAHDGWLGGTPVTAIKSMRIGAMMAGDKFSTPTTSSHRRTRSAVQPIVLPDEADSRRSTDELMDDVKVSKANRRVSAYMDYEEMVLPTLRRSPMEREGNDYGDFGELGAKGAKGAKGDKDKAFQERERESRTDEGAHGFEEGAHTAVQTKSASRQETQDEGIDQLQSPPAAAELQSDAQSDVQPDVGPPPEPTTLSTVELATELLSALRTLSDAKISDTTCRHTDEQRRLEILRGIGVQAEGVKSYVQNSELQAGKRLDYIREMIDMAEKEAAKWREDEIDLVPAS